MYTHTRSFLIKRRGEKIVEIRIEKCKNCNPGVIVFFRLLKIERLLNGWEDETERGGEGQMCAGKRNCMYIYMEQRVSMFAAALQNLGAKRLKPSLHGNVNSAARQVGHCTCADGRNPAKFDRFRKEGRRKVRRTLGR